jgi:calcyclin binding protein
MQASSSDLQELESLLQQTKSPFVKSLIEKDIVMVKENLEKQTSVSQEQQSPHKEGVLLKKETVKPSTDYQTLNSFYWEQQDDVVKIYVSLEGVSTVKTEDILTRFTESSFEVFIHNLNGINYKFSLSNLSHTINPNASAMKTRSKRFIISLKKKENKHWDSLQKKEDPLKLKKPDTNKDPEKGLMDLMKNLYESGDDEMKRTIAKAWVESREKQGAK